MVYLFIYGDTYKLHQQKLMHTFSGLIQRKLHFPPPGGSIFLMITKGQAYLSWLRQQLTQCSYFL